MYNTYSSPTYSDYGSGAPTDPAALIAAFIIGLVIGLIFYVVYALFLGMIFKKAGIESWKAWVPFYNMWIFFELGGQKGWLSLLSLLVWIPLVGIIPAIVAAVYAVIAAHKIGLNFGKEGVFVLLYLFVSPVWLIWLALDKTAIWRGAGMTQQAVPAGPSNLSAPVANAPISDPDNPTTPNA